MPLYSAAQTLPPHIVQSIVSYVVWTKDVGSKMDEIQITANNRKDLFILMKVCHHWRSVVLPLYYYSASISLYGAKKRYINQHAVDMLDLDKVSENKRQHHIQKLHIFLWNSAIVNPQAVIISLRDTVKRYGPLKRVRAVILDIQRDWPKKSDNSLNMHDATVTDKLEITCVEYAIILNELLPNKRQLVFQSTREPWSDVDYWLTIHAPNYFYFLLGENINSIQLKRFRISEQLADDLKITKLQYLSIDYYKGSSLCIDLIRQNSASLECLYLDSFPQTYISLLVLLSGDSGVLTYPRLKKLKIGHYSNRPINAYKQFEHDPFPVLEQIICKGELNHWALAVLQIGRLHIQKLELYITLEAMDAIERNNIFTTGSYSALSSMCIRISSSFPYFDIEKASRLIAMLLNLSSTTRHVHLHDFHRFNFDGAVFSDIVQSDLLRTLNLSGMELTIHQVIWLASRFKKLDRLTVALKDYPNGGFEAPDDNEIQRWKDELKAYTSNVRTICIESVNFPSLRRGVEYVMFMVRILEGVGKVAFKFNRNDEMLYDLLNGTRYALQCPVHKMYQYVQSVEFCMDCLLC